MPATGMPRPGHPQIGSVRKAKAWAALAKAAAFLGCQQREEAIPQQEKLGHLSLTLSSSCWGIPVQGNIPPPAHGRLAGVCILSDRQIDLIHLQLTFLSSTETSLNENISSLSKPAPLSWLELSWAGQFNMWLFNKERSKELRWQSLEDRHASYISSALDQIQ